MRRSAWLEGARADGRSPYRPCPQRRDRNRDEDGIIPVLARTAREVEAAGAARARAAFGPDEVPGRGGAGAPGAGPGTGRGIGSRARRSWMLKRLDGIALILAQTAARDTSLLALLAEDAVLSDAARALMRKLLRTPGWMRPRSRSHPASPPRPPPPADRRVVPQAVVSRQLANPFLAPDFSAARPSAAAARRLATWELLGPLFSSFERPAGEPRRAWRCPRRRRCRRRAAAADAAPGAAGRRGRGRAPELPARRRAGPGQDGPGAARRAGGERLPAARGRAERGQDQLGPRGRAVDPQQVGHRDPRQRRHDGRLRRHRRGQLRGARPPRGLDRRLRLPRHGRRRGALHQEQELPALAARAAALRSASGPASRGRC